MYKKYIILFFSFVIIIFVTSTILTLLLFHKPLYTNAEYWLQEAITIKKEHNKTINSPKIIIASGSNSLFGISSPLLQEKTGINVLNLGLHASLPLEFIINLVQKFTNPNDIVLLPLEYNYYCSDKKFTNWQINNLTTWGTEYLKDYSLIEYCQITLSSIKSRLLTSIFV